jgi:ribosomal protein S18 acetylase RimI-like enzyme
VETGFPKKTCDSKNFRAHLDSASSRWALDRIGVVVEPARADKIGQQATEGGSMTFTDDIAVQPLRAEDHADWLPLWKGYQAFYAVDIPPATTALTWTRLLDPAEPVGGALAWRGATAIGLVHHIRHRSCWTEGDYCYLQDLFVASAARQAGIGRMLIEYVYALAAREGCARVYWLTHETNSVAIALYDRIAKRTGFIQYRKDL